MTRVTGIGGLFVKARDPERMTAWYADHLGVLPPPESYETPSWWQDAGPTVFAAMSESAEHFGGPDRTWSVNFRVTDIDAMTERLRAAGVDVDVDPETYPNGRFATVRDPEGTVVQLWEPAGADLRGPDRAGDAPASPSRTQVELFYVGDADEPSGAVVTSIAQDCVTCRVRFRTPTGEDGADAVIRFDGSLRTWSELTFTADGVTRRATRAEVASVVAEGQVEGGRPVIPSYGLAALALELAAGQERSLELRLLDESAWPTATVSPARLVRAGTEVVTSPVAGTLTGCERIELSVDGRRTHTFWVKGGVVVASDWAGARSYALPQAAADGLTTVLGG